MSVDEVVKALLEVLRIVAWPLVVFGIFWFLRHEAKRAAARITELGLTGAKFASPTEQTPQPPATGVSESLPTLPPSKLPAAGTPQTFIDRVKSFISSDQLDPAVQSVQRDLVTQVGDVSDVAKIEVLTYALASANVQLAHERNYNAIFGSQLHLLHLMNVGAGVPPNIARQVYDAATAALSGDISHLYI